VDRIETEQARQGGILDEIRDRLTGSPAPADPVTRADPAPDPVDMAEQMRQAVRDVNAEAAASTTQPSTPVPEITPREVMVKGKEKLQKIMFGSEPKR
jgi:hypothetical protein